MKKLEILIVEGNLKEENQSFSQVGIQTHTESLKESLGNFNNEIIYDVINPSSDENLQKTTNNLEKYDGLIWGGSSLNIYNNTPEIRRQIEFMSECQKRVKNILAICWGMQVAVTAAGGEVKKANRSHIGIANQITINKDGINHSLYKNKINKFNSPAFNFDEVVKLPHNGVCLASNNINSVQSLYFDNFYKQMYNDSVEGLAPRKKIRVRNYPKNLSNIFQFETKISSIEGRHKTTKKISKEYFEKILNNGYFDSKYGLCKPQLNVIYDREYLKKEDIRITIDTNIVYNVYNCLTKKKDANVIVELKTSKNKNVDDIFEQFPFQEIRFSKYCNGIELFNKN